MSRRGLQSRRRYISRQHPIPETHYELLLEIGIAGRFTVASFDPRNPLLADLIRHRLVVSIGYRQFVLTDTGQQLAAHIISERFKR